MVYVLNTTGKLGSSDVSTIIDLTVQGKEIVSDSEYDNIVLYSKKDVIKAKTPTQAIYFDVVKRMIFVLPLVRLELEKHTSQ